MSFDVHLPCLSLWTSYLIFIQEFIILVQCLSWFQGSTFVCPFLKKSSGLVILLNKIPFVKNSISLVFVMKATLKTIFESLQQLITGLSPNVLMKHYSIGVHLSGQSQSFVSMVSGKSQSFVSMVSGKSSWPLKKFPRQGSTIPQGGLHILVPILS